MEDNRATMVYPLTTSHSDSVIAFTSTFDNAPDYISWSLARGCYPHSSQSLTFRDIQYIRQSKISTKHNTKKDKKKFAVNSNMGICPNPTAYLPTSVVPPG